MSKKIQVSVIVALALMFSLAVEARINDTLLGEDTNFTRMNSYYLRHGIERFEISDDVRNDRTEVPFRLAYGMMHNFEIGTDIPYLIFSGSNSGLGDIRIYQKYKFSEEDQQTPALVGGLALYLPTGDEDKATGTGKVAFEIYGVGMRTLGQYTVNLHLGYRFQGNSRYDNVLTYNLAIKSHIPQIARGVSGVLELNGSKSDWDEVYITPSLLWEPREAFHLGFGMRIGLTKDSYDYGTVIKIGHDF